MISSVTGNPAGPDDDASVCVENLERTRTELAILADGDPSPSLEARHVGNLLSPAGRIAWDSDVRFPQHAHTRDRLRPWKLTSWARNNQRNVHSSTLIVLLLTKTGARVLDPWPACSLLGSHAHRTPDGTVEKEQFLGITPRSSVCSSCQCNLDVFGCPEPAPRSPPFLTSFVGL